MSHFNIYRVLRLLGLKLALLCFLFEIPLLSAQPNTLCNLNSFSKECRRFIKLTHGQQYMGRFSLKQKDTALFSCDLKHYSGQCREFVMMSHEIGEKSPPLEDGCRSMGGKFSTRRCPDAGTVGSCVNTIYDDHDKESVVYNNHYYKNGGQFWSQSDVERVCKNLGGTYKVAGSKESP